MGRYTLKSDIEGMGLVVIKVPENEKKKEKVSLMAIDAITLGSNPIVVLKTLDFDEAKLVSQGKFYISYISGKEEKQLNVLWNDAHGLKSIAEEGNRQISETNQVFHQFIDKVFLPLTNDWKFMNFVRDNGFLSPKLNEWIGNLYSNRYGKNFCIQKIKEYAASYKKFRALVMAVELYKNPNYLKFDPNIKYIEERDPDLDGFYSEEEKEEYREYMASLPEEQHPHEEKGEYDSKHL